MTVIDKNDSRLKKTLSRQNSVTTLKMTIYDSNIER